MALYLRFMITLAFGLTGLTVVLMILTDKLFQDWDFFAEVGGLISDVLAGKSLIGRERAEDALLDAEKRRAPQATVRLIEQRREQLKELSAVESRLSRKTTVQLTPLPPPVYSSVK